MGRCPRRHRDLPVRRGRARVDVLRRAGRRCRCACHGAALLREAMAIRGEMGMESYDRFFPAQDYMPKRGFGT